MAIRAHQRQAPGGENLDEGALGVFTQSRVSTSAIRGDARVCEACKKYERPLHLRYSSSEKELKESTKRFNSRATAVCVFTSITCIRPVEHFIWSRRWKDSHGKCERSTITTCVYPYSFWATYLSNNRFGAGWQRRYGLSYGDLRIVGSSERLTARTFAHYRNTLAARRSSRWHDAFEQDCGSRASKKTSA